jgi:hypothetical protein
MDAQQQIIAIFKEKVQGRKSTVTKGGADGDQGHWLEKQFGLKANGNNAPDILGYEMKNDTKGKTTFGDWQASVYIFDKNVGSCTRKEFLLYFGAPNNEKGGRLSWSGKPSPNVKKWNDFGQKLLVDETGSIFALYRFDKDQRSNKEELIPARYREKPVTLAFWDRERMKKLVEAKFNVEGWFKCLKDESGTYIEIAFGKPVTFEMFIDGVRKGEIYLDSGMYEGNPRPYQNWRADNRYWFSLIVGRYR